MNKYMTVTDHGTRKILTTGFTELRPIELHHKSDGTKDDKPSFAIILRDLDYNKFIGQFSLNTIADCFDQLGYKLVPKSEIIDLTPSTPRDNV